MSNPSVPDPGRILLLSNNFPPTLGGSAVVYANLARHLEDRVIVLAPRRSYNDGLALIGWREHDRVAKYRVVRRDLLRTQLRPIVPGFWRRQAYRIEDLFIRLRLSLTILGLVVTSRVRTICIGELLASSWVITLVQFIPGLRSVVYVHGEEITTEDGYDIGHRRARAALVAADGVVVVSRFTQMAVRALLGSAAAHKTIQLIENGVDTERFVPMGRRPDLVAFYGLEGRPVFVSVCRLLEKKGIDHAIRAFAQILPLHPESRYLIVGSGPYEPILRALVAELNVATQVIFVGQVTDEDLVAHYCLGDVFVMPNRELPDGDTEGFGLVFLEANSCGLPVIAGCDGGSRDAVQDGVNGVVVNGASVPAIADAMRDLLENPGLYARLQLGAAEVSRKADWQEKALAFTTTCAALFRPIA
jgi:phosphatidylinositol alpha-1,6-mannosyltransferase